MKVVVEEEVTGDSVPVIMDDKSSRRVETSSLDITRLSSRCRKSTGRFRDGTVFSGDFNFVPATQNC